MLAPLQEQLEAGGEQSLRQLVSLWPVVIPMYSVREFSLALVSSKVANDEHECAIDHENGIGLDACEVPNPTPPTLPHAWFSIMKISTWLYFAGAAAVLPHRGVVVVPVTVTDPDAVESAEQPTLLQA